MTPEQEKFLNDIAAKLKTQPGFNDVEQLFFPLRFDKNRPTLYQHKDIAENLMRPEGSKLPLDFYSKSIGTTVQNIVSGMVGRLKTEHKKAISGLYEAEIRADGVDVDSLLNGKQGERGTWEVVYDWLWKHKYLRWLDENGWQILQEKAKSPPNWLQFLTEEEMTAVQVNRGLVRQTPPPSVQKITLTIPANQSLWMEINLESLERSNYQLLLLNRSEDGQCLLCPSSGYAPNSIMDKRVTWFPQKDSWADYNKQNFMFGEAGNEEFLAIALEKPLSLPWLTPHQEEEFPEWNAERIKELFEQLEQQGNWQVFYQSFDVEKQ
jgi:hypothetical protein